MYKIKKRPKPQSAPSLYNILENYTDFEPPGNVMVCASTAPEDLEAHAKVLGESYEVPHEEMVRLLEEGGVYVYPQAGTLITRGLFACRVDPSGEKPKRTWTLDLEQYSQAIQLTRAYGHTLEDAAERVFSRTLPPELQERLQQKNLGLDYSKLGREITRHGDIKYIDFRKDWSPYFKRKCIMPDGKLVETGGIEEFAEFHGITAPQARRLLEEGGTLDVEGGVLACQIINGQPSVARFNSRQYKQARDLVAARGIHLMDALSEVGLTDPVLMRALKRLERD